MRAVGVEQGKSRERLQRTARVLEARGRIALFTDADLSSPIEEIEKLLAALAGGHDIAIGSRALDRSLISIHQARHRELAGIIFNGLMHIVTGLPFQDTQCGFKIFRREPSRIIFEQQRIERFGFNPEILFLAECHGLRVAEVSGALGARPCNERFTCCAIA